MHSKYYNFMFGAALALIVIIFGLAFYFLVTFSGQIDAKMMVVLSGAGIGLLALATGIFFVVAQVDKYLVENSQLGDDENY
jgi:hypothetical protein